MSLEHTEARHGAYADSVRLMQISQLLGAVPGVLAAQVAMGTTVNRETLTIMGFAPPPGAGPNDLVVAVRATGESELHAALAALEQELAGPAASSGSAAGQPPSAQQPRTIASAARQAGPALALISVPGPHAVTEAMDALDAGCDVMIFSDNVPVDQEIALKDIAAERGLLVLGPDCGTSVVDGVGLGFAHSLAPGPVGMVAASGTGAQQVLCLLDSAGVGVSAALGVGGRDLSAQVSGRSTMAALAVLDADPDTRLIIIVSKPPAAAVEEQIREFASRLRTPVEFALVGPGQPDLTACTERALARVGAVVPRWRSWPGRATAPRPGYLRGLFAGGTLCDEAMVIASAALGPIASNIPLPGAGRIEGLRLRGGHLMIDFGDDALTAGRPHPMIDPTLRLRCLAEIAADPDTSVIMLDVVLGYGAHGDPAANLAPAVAGIAPDIVVVVSIIGAAADPQDLSAQAEALTAAGAHVFASNAQATRRACELVRVPQ